MVRWLAKILLSSWWKRTSPLTVDLQGGVGGVAVAAAERIHHGG